jgi:hypothetical protein
LYSSSNARSGFGFFQGEKGLPIHTPELAEFDYGRLEITRKWGKMNELEMNLEPSGLTVWLSGSGGAGETPTQFSTISGKPPAIVALICEPVQEA